MTRTKANNSSLDPALGYRLFERLLARVTRSITSQSAGLLGYHKEVVAERVLQRVTELAAYSFVAHAATRQEQGHDPHKCADATGLYGGLHFRRDSVVAPLETRLRLIIDFAGQWVRVLAWVLSKAATRAHPSRRTTLLVGIGSADIWVDACDKRFVAFCERGPITPIVEAEHLIVECTEPRPSSSPERITYARNALLTLLQTYRPRGSELIRFLLQHCAAGMDFLLYAVRSPLGSLLGRDLALHTAVAYLNRAGVLQAVVVTNSTFQVQPLWMRGLPNRRFGTHMAWYSQNTIPFVYKRDGVAAVLPHYRHMQVDVHWVWTEGYAKHIQSICVCNDVRVVGPILWYLPEIHESGDSLRVSIFDVTPMKESYARKIGLHRNYYCAENVSDFLETAVRICHTIAANLGIRIEVVLKHKRAHSTIHDANYITVVDSLARAGSLSLVNPQCNLYALIRSSAAIIVIPFSSPAYVASVLGVPAIYFDASEAIEPTAELAPHIYFAGGEAELGVSLTTVFEQHHADITSPPQRARTSWRG